MNKNKNKAIPNLEEKRLEKLTELGAKLRQIRLEQQLTLEDVAVRTMIAKSTLEAIEEAQIDELPEPVYIQGFIRRFATALGLNGSSFASDFPTQAPMRLLNYSSWIRLPWLQLRPVHLYFFYIVLIASSVQALSSMLNRPLLQANNLDGQQHSTEVTLEGTAKPASQLRATSVLNQGPKNGSVPDGPVRIGLTLKADSWIEVEADGQTAFQGVLAQGTQRTWQAKQQLIVRAGNAGGVLVAVNDGQAKQMGAPGEVEELQVKAN